MCKQVVNHLRNFIETRDFKIRGVTPRVSMELAPEQREKFSIWYGAQRALREGGVSEFTEEARTLSTWKQDVVIPPPQGDDDRMADDGAGAQAGQPAEGRETLLLGKVEGNKWVWESKSCDIVGFNYKNADVGN